MTTELLHVTDSSNRASIEAGGLNWELWRTPGVAGALAAEREGIFLCRDDREAEYFSEMALGGGRMESVDVWEFQLEPDLDLDAEGPWDGGLLEVGDEGYLCYLAPIPRQRLSLVVTGRTHVGPELIPRLYPAWNWEGREAPWHKGAVFYEADSMGGSTVRGREAVAEYFESRMRAMAGTGSTQGPDDGDVFLVALEVSSGDGPGSERVPLWHRVKVLDGAVIELREFDDPESAVAETSFEVIEVDTSLGVQRPEIRQIPQQEETRSDTSPERTMGVVSTTGELDDDQLLEWTREVSSSGSLRQLAEALRTNPTVEDLSGAIVDGMPARIRAEATQISVEELRKLPLKPK